MSNISSMFGNTDVMNAALTGLWKRNEVISDNIANVDTPGYKRQDVDFESYMQDALKNAGTNDANGVAEQSQPSVYTDNQQLSYRADGNNVDVDTEMVYLAQNQLKYNTLISQVSYDFERLKAVLQ